MYVCVCIHSFLIFNITAFEITDYIRAFDALTGLFFVSNNQVLFV